MTHRVDVAHSTKSESLVSGVRPQKPCAGATATSETARAKGKRRTAKSRSQLSKKSLLSRTYPVLAQTRPNEHTPFVGRKLRALFRGRGMVEPRWARKYARTAPTTATTVRCHCGLKNKRRQKETEKGFYSPFVAARQLYSLEPLDSLAQHQIRPSRREL